MLMLLGLALPGHAMSLSTGHRMASAGVTSARSRVPIAPMACAEPSILPELPVELREASGWAEDFAASRLLNECFGGSP